jgi:hypothetical protein
MYCFQESHRLHVLVRWVKRLCRLVYIAGSIKVRMGPSINPACQLRCPSCCRGYVYDACSSVCVRTSLRVLQPEGDPDKLNPNLVAMHTVRVICYTALDQFGDHCFEFQNLLFKCRESDPGSVARSLQGLENHWQRLDSRITYEAELNRQSVKFQ